VTVDYNDPVNPLLVSIPVAPAAGTNPLGYVPVRRTTAGDAVMPFSVYKDGEIMFKTAATGTLDIIYNNRPFSDVDWHWAADPITFASARGLFSGTGGGLFSPNTSMTRAMFAQVLANIEGADLSAYEASRFTDVADGAWYAAAIEWAADKGIVNGIGGGQFNPSADITREQMAVMLMNYARHKGYVLPAEQAAAFADEASVSPWALDAVKRVQAAGVVSGRPGHIYDPQGLATRAEVAAVFTNFITVVVTDIST
jgi:hypothetical protein